MRLLIGTFSSSGLEVGQIITDQDEQLLVLTSVIDLMQDSMFYDPKQTSVVILSVSKNCSPNVGGRTLLANIQNTYSSRQINKHNKMTARSVLFVRISSS